MGNQRIPAIRPAAEPRMASLVAAAATAGRSRMRAPPPLTVRRAPAVRGGRNSAQEKIGGDAAHLVAQSGARGTLPPAARARLEVATGHSFAHVAVHDDPAAHRAADLVGARAFALGRDLYFGRNQYAPSTPDGMRLLAHEAAHTLQQDRAAVAPAIGVAVGPAADRLEHEADQFAAAIMAGAPPPRLSSGSDLRVQRAVSFTHGNHSLAMTPLDARDVPGGPFPPGARGLQISPGEENQGAQGSFFEWQADVTAHGAATDPFGNYEAGILQVLRGVLVYVRWGDGTPYDAQLMASGPVPIRDAYTAADTWVTGYEPSVTPPFAADGDVRTPAIWDRGYQLLPLSNPVHPGKTHVGEFRYGAQFTTYLAVRDTSVQPVAKPAFQVLAHVDWQDSISGAWDEQRPPGAKVQLTVPPAQSSSGVIDGDSTAVPAIIGGPVANEAIREPFWSYPIGPTNR